MKPLLKWAGGKRWLLPILHEFWSLDPHRKLVEPFTGGMAVALGLQPKGAVLNDANVHLVNFYKQVAKGLVIRETFENASKTFYENRDRFNELIRKKKYKNKEAAALFYFLIKTGFNGLCRFNSSGEFNVPFGQHRTIQYRTDFTEYKQVLKSWDIRHGDFCNLTLEGNEFLYADPPYDVEFTKYYGKGFDWDDQVRLAEWLSKHEGPVIASNQATKRVLELYGDLKYDLYTVFAPRLISCNGNREPAVEMLAIKGLRPKRDQLPTFFELSKKVKA